MEPVTVLMGVLGLIIATVTVAKLIVEPVSRYYTFQGDIQNKFHSQAMINQDLRNSLLSLEARVRHLESWATTHDFGERKNEYRHNPMSDSDFVRRNPD